MRKNAMITGSNIFMIEEKLEYQEKLARWYELCREIGEYDEAEMLSHESYHLIKRCNRDLIGAEKRLLDKMLNRKKGDQECEELKANIESRQSHANYLLRKYEDVIREDVKILYSRAKAKGPSADSSLSSDSSEGSISPVVEQLEKSESVSCGSEGKVSSACRSRDEDALGQDMIVASLSREDSPSIIDDDFELVSRYEVGGGSEAVDDSASRENSLLTRAGDFELISKEEAGVGRKTVVDKLRAEVSRSYGLGG